jgi:hypothetical protein
MKNWKKNRESLGQIPREETKKTAKIFSPKKPENRWKKTPEKHVPMPMLILPKKVIGQRG